MIMQSDWVFVVAEREKKSDITNKMYSRLLQTSYWLKNTHMKAWDLSTRLFEKKILQFSFLKMICWWDARDVRWKPHRPVTLDPPPWSYCICMVHLSVCVWGGGCNIMM